MKLLFCEYCRDMFSLKTTFTYCQCKETWGIYVNDVEIVHHNGIVIGLDNFHLCQSIILHKDNEGCLIPCWTYPTPKSVQKLDIDFGFIYRRALGLLCGTKMNWRPWWLIQLTLWIIGFPTFHPKTSEWITRQEELSVRLQKVKNV